MNRVDTYLRAFGMSGAQAVSGIEAIERRTGQPVLAKKQAEKLRKLSGYEQFESDVRRDATTMSEYYEIFYCLEVSIRRLVESTLLEAEGPDWWQSTRIKDGFRTEVKNLRNKDAESGMTPRSDLELDYLTFGQLGEVITTNFDVFETVLNSKQAVSRIMNQLNQLRNPIAHCCVLAEDEKERLELVVRDWFRALS